MSDFRARILAELDTSKIPSQLQKISRDNTLVLKVNTGGSSQKLQDINQEMRGFIALQKKISGAKLQLGKIELAGGGKNQIKVLKSQIEELETAYASAMQTFMKKLTTSAANIDFKDVINFDDEIIGVVKRATDQLDLFDARVADTRAKMASNVSTKLFGGSMETSIAQLAAKYEEFASTGHPKLELIKDDLTRLRELNQQMGSASSVDELLTDYSEYNNVLLRVKNSLATIAAETKSFVSLSQINSLDNQMSLWLQKNSKATSDFGADIQKLRKRLSELDGSCEDSKGKLDAIEQEFREIKNQAALAGKTGKSFGTQLTAAFKSIWRYVGISTIIFQIVNALKQMCQNVFDVNTAMTELRKVTDETDETYDKFLDNAGKKAQKLGTTISELVESTADFARLGFSFSESESLAEVANIYAVVGDEIEDIDAATQSIISTMAAFKIEANDAMTIVDKFNAVGNNFAISSGGIGEALQRSASSLAAANNTLDESIALITAANTVVQDADSVGKRILPTLKITISVKSQRWSRPRKDFIDVVTRQLGRACFLFYQKGEIYIAKECTHLLSVVCENCGKIVTQTRTQYNRAKHHYCSGKCQKEFQHKETHETRQCLICNKEFEVSKRSTQNLCSTHCQKEWQKLQIGEKNPRYTREKTNCECCGKEIIVKKYKTKNGQHLFCSDRCRRDWYSNVWSQQDSWKEKSRIRATKILESGSISTNTKPQKIVNDMLKKMNVGYINEKSYKYYCVDNYLFEPNLIIEVMGDFWHSNPLKYTDNINSIQQKRVPKDRAKHTYIKNNYNIEILYLWEDDIYNRPYLCKRLIKQYIKSKGILSNYHSFNYHIKHNKLELNENIILPYQDR